MFQEVLDSLLELATRVETFLFLIKFLARWILAEERE